MNRLEELYPYFKYLRVEGTGSYKQFQNLYCIEGSDDCNARLHCLLDQVMLRRTSKDKVLGQPIVKLPESHEETKSLPFNIVERTLYNIVSRRFIKAINKEMSKSDPNKKPGYGHVMFLRLRQMAAHTFLVQEILQDMFEEDSVDRLEKHTLEEGGDSEDCKDMIAALKRMVLAKGNPVEETPEEESPPPELGGLSLKLGKKIKKLKAGMKLDEVKEEILCHKCKGVPEEPMVSKFDMESYVPTLEHVCQTLLLNGNTDTDKRLGHKLSPRLLQGMP